MSSLTLKIIALIAMTFDHIGEFIPNSPIRFRYLGRISAPIFLYCSTWSFLYTSNKKKYLLRLYVASVIMSFIQYFFNITNNFFRVLFCLSIIFYIIELCKKNDKQFKNTLIKYLLWQLGSFFLVIVLFICSLDENFVAYVIPAILGSVFNLEGGLIFVILGILFFETKSSNKKMLIGYFIYCLIYFFISTTAILSIVLSKISYYFGYNFKDFIEYFLDTVVGLSPMCLGGDYLLQNYQWMMIFALPFLVSYNHLKGKKMKWIFYFYYPCHILILLYLRKTFS